MDGIREWLAGICIVGAVVSFAAWLIAANLQRIARVSEFVSRIPRSSLSVFLAAVLIATVCAQKPDGTNAPPNGVSPPQMMGMLPQGLAPLNLPAVGGAAPVTSDDVARSFRLEGVNTNDFYSYAMPTNGTRYSKWWLRGAYEDVFRLNLNGMRFPLGTNLYSSLWVYSWGMAGVRLGDSSNRIVATGVPMSAVPGLSQFWSAALHDGAFRLTWQDFALNRDTNTPVSAQLDLYPSGDFVTRSNLVEKAYRRVNPDDWDDDGYPNDTDPNPYDFDEGGFGPHQELPEGANTNHYYWIDVVVDDANARVTFMGDGDSHLPDPDFIAKAWETNRVMLLLGKPYAIDCIMPVRVVGKEDAEISVCSEDGRVEVVWPVYVNFGPRMRSGGGIGAAITPARAMGGNFTWPDNFCCYSFAADATPVFDCDGTCGCGGCSTGDIVYEIGGHPMSYGGVHCGCTHEECHEPDDGDQPDAPAGPGVSVSFSKSVIVFEDEYTNSINDVIARRSTDSVLTCEVYGGTNGGQYAFAIYDGGRLARKSGSYLPRSGTVNAGETFLIKIKYEALAASAEAGDISAVGTFTENGGGAALSSEATLTAAKVVICPIVEREGCENRHRMGVREWFEVLTSPSDVQCSIQCAQDWAMTNTSPIMCLCPILASANGIELNIAGETYTPNLTVVEPEGVFCPRGWDKCTTGYVAMELEPFITPLDVSFQGIAMMEVPTTTVGPSGYFTNEVFSSIWHHTIARGAGAWQKISPDNFFFRDTASFAETCPPPFADGTIDWEIVLGWGGRDSPTNAPPVGTIATHYHQVFTIDTHGSIRIDKFGQWIKQFADGTVTNSTGIINMGGGGL